MTREEIINNLLYMKRYVKENTIEDSTIDEAIKALEQQQNKDVLSRKCNNCAYYVNGANDEACDGCFEDDYEHPNFKPKAQHYGDCISRQAVINEIFVSRKNFNNEFDQGFFADKIIALPSVTPKEKTGRIPVSERLPKIQQDILLSLRSFDVEVGFRAETEPYFYCHGAYIEPRNVLAWMPSPEPYSESENKEEEK